MLEYDDGHICTPLADAVKEGHHEAVFLLLKLGVDPDLDNAYHFGCFRCFAEYGYAATYLAAGDHFSDLLVFEELDYDMYDSLGFAGNDTSVLADALPVEILRIMLRNGFYATNEKMSAVATELIYKCHSSIDNDLDPVDLQQILSDAFGYEDN